MSVEQKELLSKWYERKWKEQAAIAKADRRIRRAQYHKEPKPVAESRLEQPDWSFTDESRTFKVWPRCPCGFPAVLVKRVAYPSITYKITCTRIHCTNEVGPDSDKNKLLSAWKMICLLNKS